MQPSIQLLSEIAHCICDGFAKDLQDVGADERDWRPLPISNTINLIVRHLRLEAEWHLLSLEKGEPMPTIAVPAPQESIDAVPVDLELNLGVLTDLLTRFCRLLDDSSLESLHARTAAAYTGSARPFPPHFLAYHQLIHLAMHWGQIRTLRNLYRKTHGQPGLFPDNPTYPGSSSS